MPGQTPTGQPTGHQGNGKHDGVPIADAARILGLSTDGVRKRLARKTLPGIKVAGEWRVFLPPSALDRAIDQHLNQDTQPDTDRTTGQDGAPPTEPPDLAAVVAAKDETIAVLRDQLAAKDDQLRAAQVTILELSRRLPALPSETAYGHPVTSSDAPGRTEPRNPTPDTSHPSPVPWWRRLFGRFG